MARDWRDPDNERESVLADRYQDAQEAKAEDEAVRADARYYHYSDAWYGMEPS